MCVFCKIVNGEIPSFKIYEDQDVLAFLDISQVTEGHTLVIPKRHYENIFTLDDDISSKLFQTAQLLAKQLQKGLKIDALNIINNNGKLAGQEVNHYHLHLLPRYQDDQVSFNFPHHEFNQDNLKNIQKKILEN